MPGRPSERFQEAFGITHDAPVRVPDGRLLGWEPLPGNHREVKSSCRMDVIPLRMGVDSALDDDTGLANDFNHTLHSRCGW
jgi:hypothetical protein